MSNRLSKVTHALDRLEKIAKNITQTNLRKLRENNSLKKAYILQKLIDLSERCYTDVVRDFFNIRKERGPDDKEYKTFALYLNEFMKTKKIQRKNEGFRAMRNESDGK